MVKYEKHGAVIGFGKAKVKWIKYFEEKIVSADGDRVDALFKRIYAWNIKFLESQKKTTGSHYPYYVKKFAEFERKKRRSFLS